MLHQTQGASQERRRPGIQVTQGPAQEGGQRDAQEAMKGGFRVSAVLQTKTGNRVQAGITKNPSERKITERISDMFEYITRSFFSSAAEFGDELFPT